MRKFFYVLIFLFVAGCKLPDSSTSTTTTGKVPTPAGPVADRSAELVWAPSTGTVQGYKIEGSGDGSNFVELGVASGTSTSVIITGLYSKVTYYFRVRAFNNGANGEYGPTVAITL